MHTKIIQDTNQAGLASPVLVLCQHYYSAARGLFTLLILFWKFELIWKFFCLKWENLHFLQVTGTQMLSGTRTSAGTWTRCRLGSAPGSVLTRCVSQPFSLRASYLRRINDGNGPLTAAAALCLCSLARSWAPTEPHSRRTRVTSRRMRPEMSS